MRGRIVAGCLAVSTAAMVTFLTTGCGKKAPPFLPVPVAARELKVYHVRVRGGEVQMEFRVPKERFSIEWEEEPWVLARLLRERAGDDGLVSEERAVIREDGGFTFGERRTLVDSGLIEDEPYVYRVEMLKEKTRDRASSEPYTVSSISMTSLPDEIEADGREGGIVISWKRPPGVPEGAGYIIMRRGQEEDKPVPLLPELLRGSPYSDTRVVREKGYCYSVRAVLRDGIVDVEGPLSDEVCARAVDWTPPPPPGGLILVAADGALRLSWITADVADLKGFYIYRAVGKGSFKRLNDEPLSATSYRDDKVEPGVEYSYRVTSVDNSSSANESSFSSVVKGTVKSE